MRTMKAAVFVKPGQIVLDEKPVPEVGPGQALVKITTTTICGTDVHILKGEYPVKPGLTVGHEPVGVIAELGVGVTGYQVGQRVVVGAITPCGQCYACLDNHSSQCGGHGTGGWKAIGGWKFGNTIDGTQAEYVLVPDAVANLEPIPDDLTDEQVLMCPDIMSTGFSGAENGKVKIGDTVVIFAQGPIGLCATAGAKLRGATRIIAVDGINERLAISKRMGADVTINFREKDPIEEIMKITDGKGVDVAIEAPADTIAAGLADQTIITTLCPGGKERMRRLLNVVASGRVDLKPLVTHRFKLDDIEAAYDLFANQRDGVLKIAITP